jgi:hypothetical protein
MSLLRQFCFSTIALSGTMACATVNTHSTSAWVPGGATYRIGESERSTFEARVQNTGNVPVTILLDSGGVKRGTVLLRPDSSFSTVLGARQIAIVSNSSSQRAKVKVWTKSHGIHVTRN